MDKNILESDVLIIGGGPAGSIAAASLAQKGYSVNIIEKVAFPRFVIGESLLPRCSDLLFKNGMLEAVAAQGYMVKHGAAFERNGVFEKYDFSENIGQEYGSTYQVKREEFDHILLKEAVRYGAKLYEETEVTSYDVDSVTATAKDKDGNELVFRAKFAIDASGYGRGFPKLLGLDETSELRTRDAIFTRLTGDTRPTDGTDGYIYIYIHGNNDAWIWTIPFSDGVTSVGIVCTDEYFNSYNMDNEQFWNTIIEATPEASKRFKNSKKIAPVGKIDGYSANVSAMHGKNFCMVGNATEFLDPVFSSGVTLALESGDRAAMLIDKQLRGETVDWAEEYVGYMMKGINVFREFVNAWYDGRLHDIFFHPQKKNLIKRSISSLLGGYVWDDKNLFVRNHDTAINATLSMLPKNNKANK